NKNKIEVTSDMGIQLSSCMATEENKGIVANNFICIGGSNGKTEGVYINNSSNFLIANNSVHMATNNSSSKAFYTTSNNSNLSILNNIFAHTGGGYAYYVTTPDNVTKSDYNNLYSTGDNVGFWAANITDLPALQTAGGMEEHSLSVDPQFYANNDLHISADVLDSAGLTLAEVADDIDGEPRDLNYPDIGADEIGDGLNSAPIAINDTLIVLDELIIYPLLNDSDPDGDKYIISEIFAPMQGVALVMVGDTTIRYTPFIQPSQLTDTIHYIIRDAHNAEDTACVIISISFVGIDLTENVNRNSYSIFPNPAKDWLTVKMCSSNEHGMLKFIVYTILGKKVSENIYFFNNLQNSVNINVMHLPAGPYILRIEDEGSITSKKFIKE
ncbi:MAG: T9SS type A sorting domain-containing protein, partial [Bacteroidales bacterium]|nr:T9SS type A sorting domain-containing protein [Bacteroidales bacterium]